MLGWDRDPIHPDAFNNPMFERMVKEAWGNLPLHPAVCAPLPTH